MIHDINELDDTANRMAVLWNKANNFFNTFAGDYFKLYQEFQSGKYGSDWNIGRWLFAKVGINDSSVLIRLKSVESSLANDERVSLNRVQAEQRQQRRLEREDKKAQASSNRVARLARQHHESLVQQQKAEDDKKQETSRKNAARSKRNRETRKNRLPLVPEDAVCAQALQRCAEIEAYARNALAEQYRIMHDRVKSLQVGKDMNAKPWGWGGWVKKYIEESDNELIRRSYHDVLKYEKTRGDNVVSLHNTNAAE